MMESSIINNVKYQLVSENNINEVIDIVTEHLMKRAYLTKNAGLSYEAFYKLAMAYCKAALVENLSLIAIDLNNNNKIAGFAINEDPQSLYASNIRKSLELNAHFKPFIKVLDDLHNASINFEVKHGACFHIFLLGVIPEYQNSNVGVELVRQSENLAQKLRFMYTLIKATSPETKYLCDKLDYSQMGNLIYRDYIFNGTKPFSHLFDYDGPYLYMKNF